MASPTRDWIQSSFEGGARFATINRIKMQQRKRVRIKLPFTLLIIISIFVALSSLSDLINIDERLKIQKVRLHNIEQYVNSIQLRRDVLNRIISEDTFSKYEVDSLLESSRPNLKTFDNREIDFLNSLDATKEYGPIIDILDSLTNRNIAIDTLLEHFPD